MSEKENFDAAAFVQKSAEEVIVQLESLDDDQLVAVHDAEVADENRADVLELIAAELSARAEAENGLEGEGDPQPPAPPPAPNPEPQASAGDMVTLIAPEGSGDVSHDGKTYACQDGKVSVPYAAVGMLGMHGFKPE
ncbi:MAG TPA: hypothetical protein VKA32_01435 [Gammaproteobacteria bacterium]|nr:hypothetical protein [Gammaproteobacteria bacterium]